MFINIPTIYLSVYQTVCVYCSILYLQIQFSIHLSVDRFRESMQACIFLSISVFIFLLPIFHSLYPKHLICLQLPVNLYSISIMSPELSIYPEGLFLCMDMPLFIYQSTSISNEKDNKKRYTIFLDMLMKHQLWDKNINKLTKFHQDHEQKLAGALLIELATPSKRPFMTSNLWYDVKF